MAWGPGDAAYPRARDAEQVVSLARSAFDLATLDARISVCRACPRLVQWREQVAGDKRAAFADQPYWGRPAPGFGDEAAQVLVVGLAPAAHGANRTGRVFTATAAATGSSLRCTGPVGVRVTRRACMWATG